jgi:DNA-binding response OmpR family regulator
MRALIVGDDRAMEDVARMLLTSDGFDADIADLDKDALSQVRPTSYDISPA